MPAVSFLDDKKMIEKKMMAKNIVMRNPDWSWKKKGYPFPLFANATPPSFFIKWQQEIQCRKVRIFSPHILANLPERPRPPIVSKQKPSPKINTWREEKCKNSQFFLTNGLLVKKKIHTHTIHAIHSKKPWWKNWIFVFAYY